ncbi:MAG: hypothetical protein LBD58_05590 [Treponema sp.]|jgi:hypothetical protein|nr:hypothetical protein [Treponema sp.]
MKKTWLFFLMVAWAFSMTLVGCGDGGGDPEDGGDDPKTALFSYTGDIDLISNIYGDDQDASKGANNQGNVEGILEGKSFEKDKTYEIKITGSLSHEAIIQVVLVDTDGGWEVLSNYGAEKTGDGDTKTEKKLGQGAFETTIQVTVTKNASKATKKANVVVVQGLKPGTAEGGDRRIDEANKVTITGASVTVTEVTPAGDDDNPPEITYNVITNVTSEGNAQGDVTTITYGGIKIARDQDWKDTARFDLSFADITAKLATWEFISSKYEIEISGTTDVGIEKGDDTGVQLAIVNNNNGQGGYSGYEGIAAGAFSFKLWPGDSSIGDKEPNTLQIRWKTADTPDVSSDPVATWTNVTITLKPIAD